MQSFETIKVKQDILLLSLILTETLNGIISINKDMISTWLAQVLLIPSETQESRLLQTKNMLLFEQDLKLVLMRQKQEKQSLYTKQKKETSSDNFIMNLLLIQ